MKYGDVDDWSFMADSVADWRPVLLADAALRSGLLDRPGTVEDLARRTKLAPEAVAVVLEALEAFGLVTVVDGDTWHPVELARIAPTIHHHAAAIRSWTGLDERMRTPIKSDPGPPRSRQELAVWLDALSIGAKDSVVPMVDVCIAANPDARTVLDLGGGHGSYAVGFADRGLTVTMQDRPVVMDIVGSRLEERGVRTFAGDFFETLPEEAFDLVLLSGVAHTMPGARTALLYGRIRSVVAETGVLAVSTFLHGEQSRSRISPCRCWRSDMAAVPTAKTNTGCGSPRRASRRWTPFGLAGVTKQFCSPRPEERSAPNRTGLGIVAR